ncbi:PEP-CTERM sorting domain-containing protein [Adhaeretor mobilis]
MEVVRTRLSSAPNYETIASKAVPEPSSVVLLGAASLVGLGRRRRRG